MWPNPSTIATALLTIIPYANAKISSLTQNCNPTCAELATSFPSQTWTGDAATSDMWSLFQANAHPSCRITPRTTEEVAVMLKTIVSNSCAFAVLGGGTSPFASASNSQDGITIDLQNFKSVRFAESSNTTVEVGGGALWADVYEFLDPLNLSAAGTRNSLTGVVGSILGGGISFYSQRHGWSCDNVLEFEVVLANSSIVHATEHHHADLFFALRGGGNNLGIITRVKLETFVQPKSIYTFQRWGMRALESVFTRLERLSAKMPKEVQMVATTLGWAPEFKEFVISERLVATEMPRLPKYMSIRNSKSELGVAPVEQYAYAKTSLEMSQKMDRMNREGFYNYFGSMTFKSGVDINMKIANIFFDQVEHSKDAQGLQIYIVYNPVTEPSMHQMKKRGGNALGLYPEAGPLTIVNINLHWSLESDTPRMQTFIRNMLSQMKEAAVSSNTHHPYIFLNHCFEEQAPLTSYGGNIQRLLHVRNQVDPTGVFTILQPGHHKFKFDASEYSRLSSNFIN